MQTKQSQISTDNAVMMMSVDYVNEYDSTHCNGFSSDWNPPITRKFPTGSLYLRKQNIMGLPYWKDIKIHLKSKQNPIMPKFN